MSDAFRWRDFYVSVPTDLDHAPEEEQRAFFHASLKASAVTALASVELHMGYQTSKNSISREVKKEITADELDDIINRLIVLRVMMKEVESSLSRKLSESCPKSVPPLSTERRPTPS